MPIIESAKKAIRSSARKQAFNAARKNAALGATKKLKRLLKDGKLDEAQKVFKDAQQAIDKAAKTNYFKKNTAARKISRLAAMVRKAKGAKASTAKK